MTQVFRDLYFYIRIRIRIVLHKLMIDGKLKGMDEAKLTIEEEINLIFKNVTKRQENLQAKVISKIREKMKLHIE